MTQDELNQLIGSAPNNFVIHNAFEKCVEIIDAHSQIACLVSGGADSDVMIDMIIRCGGLDKTDFMFMDTGLEYQATKDHLDYLEQKYGIEIKRAKAVKSIPTCCREYGVPFWSKYASEMIYRLQRHNFQFEDEDFETLLEKYPNCKTALSWWCNKGKGTQMFIIERYPYLKEFMIQNPPQFKISGKCCDYAKKKTAHVFQKDKGYDLVCIGVRKYENGIRAAHKSCFLDREEGPDDFRPLFWMRDSDKEECCKHYEVTHSECYTKYGLERTGCFGCPFGKRFEDELAALKDHEPKLYNAANAIFGKSYEYTREFLKFRERMKEEKENIMNCGGCDE